VSTEKTMSTWTLKQGVDVWALAFTPDGKSLVGGIGGLRDSIYYGEVHVWNPQSGQEIRSFKGHPNPVMSLAFSHDGHVLASASGTYGAPTGGVRLWEFESGRLLHTLIETDLAIVTVAFSPDDKTLASGGTIWRSTDVSGGVVTLWNTQTGEKRMTLPPFPSYVHAVSFAPAGSRLAIASISPDNDAKVTIWDTTTGNQLQTLPPAKTAHGIIAVKCLAFSPDGRTLAAGGASGMLRLWAPQ
jgi:WD40 repeat protein